MKLVLSSDLISEKYINVKENYMQTHVTCLLI